MNIAIDASRANKPFKTGTEWYSYHIIQELKKIIPDNCQVVLYTNKRLTGGLKKMPGHWREEILNWPPKYLWTQWRLWWALLVRPPDVLFVPAHTIPFLPLRKKVRVAVTVHDVGFKAQPELYKKIQVWYHDWTMKKIRQRVNLVITDSEFSRREIERFYSLDAKKVVVVYLGYDRQKYLPQAIKKEEILNRYGINRPYLLYIGRLEKKKNIGRLVAAFALLKSDFPELKLVLAGNAGNDFEAIKEIVITNRLEQEIILPGYIPETDLPEIIRQAEVFLFLTLYEGFGLPLVQALACGTPTVTSDLNPHREIAQDGAYYCDPYQPAQIAQAVKTVLADSQLRAQLIARGQSVVKNFSWTGAAQAIWRLLASL
ncbi:MAG TPA: glycosyltransferase family 1 protein [bacterium]|nr:glycosyltransferase family 1 protein [bacterium]HNS34050.1 glycosyltransferase family 1 protein [bacterium]HNZ73104.1 glycosyltransferase family 1 protein [bacterium]HOH67021.1 glycosyltransferase family 1 protein [bacterium]HQA63641.1 glycosyltransferase family 1 protein [bacterium]